MALTEIGARLRLEGAPAYKRNADKAADATGRLGKAADRAQGGLKKLDRAINSGLKASLRGVGGAGKLAAIGIGVAATAAAALSLKFISLATDAGETESKFLTVFGKAAAEVGKFNTQITDQFGLTTKSMQDATATFGVYGQGANLAGKELVKFSTGLVQAGLDLGSFYNSDPDEVFGAIQSGLSGEAEPLRRYAIFLSEVNMEAFAAAKGIGKSVKEMTEQEKVALRGAFIMAKLGKAEGDLARTSGGLANQQRGLRGRLEETGTIIGKALLPGATRAATAMNARLIPAMKRLKDLAPAIENRFSGLVDKVMKFADSMLIAARKGGAKGMMQELDRLTGSGGKLIKKVEDLNKVFREVAWPTVVRFAKLLGKALELAAAHTKTAYVLLGLFLARAKLLLVAKAAAMAYAVAVGLVAAAQGQALVATTATTGALGAQAVAARANTVALGLMGASATGASVGVAGLAASMSAVVLPIAAATAGLYAFWKLAQKVTDGGGSTEFAPSDPRANGGTLNNPGKAPIPAGLTPNGGKTKPFKGKPGSADFPSAKPKVTDTNDVLTPNVASRVGSNFRSGGVAVVAPPAKSPLVVNVQVGRRTIGTVAIEDMEDRVARR